MKQSHIGAIAVILISLAITGEADKKQCFVKFQEDDGNTLALLTLKPSSTAACHVLTSPQGIFDTMHNYIYKGRKLEFTPVRLKYFLQQRQEHVVTRDVQHMWQFLSRWPSVPWWHDSSTRDSGKIVFTAADSSFWGMYKRLASMTPVAAKAWSNFVKAVTSKHRQTGVCELPPGYVLRFVFSGLSIMALFNYDGPPFVTAEELWTHASYSDPTDLFVIFRLSTKTTTPSIDWKIVPHNWGYIAKTIKDFGHVNLTPHWRLCDKLPVYSTKFDTLADVLKTVEYYMSELVASENPVGDQVVGQCKVSLLWHNAESMFADLILEPSAGVTCDDLRSPQGLYDAMDTRKHSKAEFYPIGINFFFERKSYPKLYALARDFDQISGILRWFNWVLWRFVGSSESIVFSAADNSLRDMYKPLFEMEAIPGVKQSYVRPRDTSSLPPRYVFHVTAGFMFWITAVFEFTGPDPFKSGTDVLTHAWKNVPINLFVKFPSDDLLDRQIGTNHWGYIADIMKDFAHVDFFNPDDVTGKEEPSYTMDVDTLADAINKNEESFRHLRRKSRTEIRQYYRPRRYKKWLTQKSMSKLLSESSESLSETSSLSELSSDESSESSAELSSDESESQAISPPKTFADILKPKSLKASQFILSFMNDKFWRKASRQQGPQVKGAL